MVENIETDAWKTHSVTEPKLRTYKCLKNIVKMNITWTTISFIAPFRTGMQSLHT